MHWIRILSNIVGNVKDGRYPIVFKGVYRLRKSDLLVVDGSVLIELNGVVYITTAANVEFL